MPLQLCARTCSDGFVAKFNTTISGSTSLLYATYLGGSYYDAATGIGIDSDGDAYVVGATLSDDFPVVAAFQPSRKAGRCGPMASSGGGGHVCASAFVAKLNPTATALVYSSYLGGTGDTAAAGVSVDSSETHTSPARQMLETFRRQLVWLRDPWPRLPVPLLDTRSLAPTLSWPRSAPPACCLTPPFWAAVAPMSVLAFCGGFHRQRLRGGSDKFH